MRFVRTSSHQSLFEALPSIIPSPMIFTFSTSIPVIIEAKQSSGFPSQVPKLYSSDSSVVEITPGKIG